MALFHVSMLHGIFISRPAIKYWLHFCHSFGRFFLLVWFLFLFVGMRCAFLFGSIAQSCSIGVKFIYRTPCKTSFLNRWFCCFLLRFFFPRLFVCLVFVISKLQYFISRVGFLFGRAVFNTVERMVNYCPLFVSITLFIRDQSKTQCSQPSNVCVCEREIDNKGELILFLPLFRSV